MKKFVPVFLVLMALFLLPGCLAQKQQDAGSGTSIVSVSPDGLMRVVIPENLLGGKSAKEAINSEDPFTKENFSKYFTAYAANDDGTATFTFTPEQYRTYKNNMYTFGFLQKTFPDSSIKNVVYEADDMTKIAVYVDKEAYSKGTAGLMDRQLANSGLAVYAGQYQILCNVPFDQWHTTITVLDNAAKEVISKNDFPNENMYRAY